MHNSLWVGLVAGLGVLGASFGLSPLLQSGKAIGTQLDKTKTSVPVATMIAPEGEVNRGHTLFDRNCAHCHGDDARGDEGPSLYNLAKSDGRITKIIKDGIKGEMPSFVKKFNDADVQALIDYLRTLKDSEG